MAGNNNSKPRVSPVGECALLVTFNGVLTLKAHQCVRNLDERLGESLLAGVTEWIPAYTSLLVLYDPLQVQRTGG
jgi:inhibitor of KinA